MAFPGVSQGQDHSEMRTERQSRGQHGQELRDDLTWDTVCVCPALCVRGLQNPSYNCLYRGGPGRVQGWAEMSRHLEEPGFQQVPELGRLPSCTWPGVLMLQTLAYPLPSSYQEALAT